MRYLAIIAAVLVTPIAGAQTRNLGDFGWLVGCWERTAANGRTVEFWSAPDRHGMLGGSYFVTDSSVREREQLRMWTAGDTLIYEAHPSSQARTLFKTTTATSGEFTVENPLHDFPQRIVYRRQGTDSLIARIEGDRGGRRAPVTYAFKRADCRGLGPSPAATARHQLQQLYDEMAVRELREPGSRYSWFVEQSLPGYTFVLWSTPGSTVATWDSTTLKQNAEAARRSAASIAPQVLSFSATVTVERVLVRGDTVKALVRSEFKRLMTGAAGRPDAGEKHERQTTQMAIDTWLRQDGRLRLRSTESISEIVSLDGKPIVIDGRSVPPTP